MLRSSLKVAAWPCRSSCSPCSATRAPLYASQGCAIAGCAWKDWRGRKEEAEGREVLALVHLDLSIAQQIVFLACRIAFGESAALPARPEAKC